MSRVRSIYLLLLVSSMLFGVVGLQGTTIAAELQRGISLSTIYPSVTIAKNQDVTLPINVANRGEVDEQINISISSAPQGWEASLVNREFAPYGVRSLFLPVGEEARQIYFRAKPPVGVESGDYIFVLKAISQDKLVESSLEITVGIEEKTAVLARVKLTTTYPSLRGPASSSFEFSIDLTNEGSEDRTFDFSAMSPPQWEVSFRPEYEPKLIAVMGMKAGETKAIQVELTPPKNVSPGDYVTTVQATSGNIEGSIDLTATVLEEEKEPTYELALVTMTGRLDAEAIAGQESHLSIVIANRGSGELKKINFYSTKPEGWILTFTPKSVDSLAAGELLEVDVAIKPTSNSIAGDYAVTLRASGDRDSDSIELRVALGTATTWGWIGLGIVAVVIAGMVVFFWQLGRR